MKFSTYIFTSIAVAASYVYYAYYVHRQFYPTMVYLVYSKYTYLLIGNFLLAVGLLIGSLLKSIFFGKLRDAEVELLIERSKYAFTETCLLLTVFRNEISAPVITMFGALILFKVLHKLTKCRLEYLEQIAPVPLSSQVRVGSLLAFLLVTDFIGTALAVQYVVGAGRSVLILLGFEFLLMLIYTIKLWARFIAQVIDSYSESGLASKGLYLMIIDLVCEAVELVTYVAFFCLIFTYYGLPLNIIRDVVAAFVSFQQKTMNFIRYLRLSNNLNQRFPDATAEEIASAGDCLVCREEMTHGKKLPCGHVFHIDCLRTWLEHQQTCPLCRSDMSATAHSAAAAGAAAAAAADAVEPAQADGAVDHANAAAADNAAAAAVNEDPAEAQVNQAHTHTQPRHRPQPSTEPVATASQPFASAPRSQPAQDSFPTFVGVTHTTRVSILAEPSEDAVVIRTVLPGVVLFSTTRVVDAAGSSWLKVPNGWAMETDGKTGRRMLSPMLEATSTVPARPSAAAATIDAVADTGDVHRCGSSSTSCASLTELHETTQSTSSGHHRRHAPFATTLLNADDEPTGKVATEDEDGVVPSDRTAWIEESMVMLDRIRSGLDVQGPSRVKAAVQRQATANRGVGSPSRGGRKVQQLQQYVDLQAQIQQMAGNLTDMSLSVLKCQRTLARMIEASLEEDAAARNTADADAEDNAM